MKVHGGVLNSLGMLHLLILLGLGFVGGFAIGLASHVELAGPASASATMSSPDDEWRALARLERVRAE